MIRKFFKDESGQGMTEYILIVALIAVAAIVAVKMFGSQITGLFSKSSDKISNQTSDAFKE
jgi:pilus assembly protein Flp/PilA